MRSQLVTYRGPVFGSQLWSKCEFLVLSLFLASLSLHIHTDLLSKGAHGLCSHGVLLAFCGPPPDTSALCALSGTDPGSQVESLNLPG